MKKITSFRTSEWSLHDFFIPTNIDDGLGWEEEYKTLREEFVEAANEVLEKYAEFNNNSLPIRFQARGNWQSCKVVVMESQVFLRETTTVISSYAFGSVPENPTKIEAKLIEIWPEIEDAFVEACQGWMGKEALCQAVKQSLQHAYKQNPDEYVEMVQALVEAIKSAKDHPDAHMIADDLLSPKL